MADDPTDPWDNLMKKPFWTVEDLGRFLTKSPDGIRKMRLLGHLPRVYRPGKPGAKGKTGLGNRIYWKRDEVLEWMDSGAEPDDFTPKPPPK